jgi:hypothetical protein
MRRSWLRRNRLIETLRHTSSVLEGFWFLPPAARRFLKSAHFFGEAPERRPWAIKREDRPAAFAGRSKSRLSCPSSHRDTAVAYTGKYPIPPRIVYRQLQHATPAGNLRNQPEILVRTSGATTAEHYTGQKRRYRKSGGLICSRRSFLKGPIARRRHALRRRIPVSFDKLHSASNRHRLSVLNARLKSPPSHDANHFTFQRGI